MIVPVPWRDVRPHQRVILESGRVVHVMPGVAGVPEARVLRAANGATRVVRVDPLTVVPVVVEQRDVAVALLASAFNNIEYLRDES